MASGAKLQLKFGTLSGVKTWSFSYADTEVTQSDVVTAMQAMIDNGSIYQYPPLTADSAKIVITTESDFDVSGVTPANQSTSSASSLRKRL